MSEEQIKIWKKVEAKGLEKLGNIEKALLAKEGFKEAHKDYCDFVDRLVDGREFRVTLEDSRKTAIAILAILESAEKGVPVEIEY